MNLSWNTLSTYLKCPRMYKFMMDRVEYPKDSRNAILGICIQKLFEVWYNEAHYWEKDQWLYANFDRIWGECQAEGKSTGGWGAYCPWENKQQEAACMEDAREQIAHLFNMICKYRLLTKKSHSEFLWKSKLGQGDTISGSIDFVIERPTGELYVLDAKGTRYKTRYLDKRQLIFYNLGMVLAHGDRWREAECAWLIYRNELYEPIIVSDDDLDNMKDLCIKVMSMIKTRKFEATQGDACRFCNWKKKCPALNEGMINDGLFE